MGANGVKIEKREIASLGELHALLAETRALRADIVAKMAGGDEASASDADSLENVQKSLEEIATHDGRPVLDIALGGSLGIDLDHEIGELKKDIFFLRYDEDPFLVLLATQNQGFYAEVNTVEHALDGKQFNVWLTSLDGTVVPPCLHSNVSGQSAYSALWMTRFARALTQTSVVITPPPGHEVDALGSQDFELEDDFAFLEQSHRLDLSSGPLLTSGCSPGDLVLVRTGMYNCPETWAVFVTTDPGLEEEVRALCPNVVIASSPDVFVAALNQLALKA
ncbi:MAG: hypothetical protein KKB70_00010 [Proteobacteria bacterium]|nr:hypothetical protein [Pseudomonadota bacterium]MBU1610458.1 hypothetical protein [Pseudomonadota bacterium]